MSTPIEFAFLYVLVSFEFLRLDQFEKGAVIHFTIKLIEPTRTKDFTTKLGVKE